MPVAQPHLLLIAAIFAPSAAAMAGPNMVQCREIELKSIVAVEDCIRTKHTAYVPKCRFEAGSITRQVNAIVESKLRDAADYDGASDAAGDGTVDCEGEAEEQTRSLEADCEKPFRVADVVSYPCRTVWDRPRPGGQPWSINLQLGPSVREIELSDLVVDEAAEHQLWELVCADLRRQMTEQDGVPETEDDEFDREERLAAATHGSVTLTPEGLRVSYDHFAFGWSIADSTIPYDRLKGILVKRLLPEK